MKTAGKQQTTPPFREKFVMRDLTQTDICSCSIIKEKTVTILHSVWGQITEVYWVLSLFHLTHLTITQACTYSIWEQVLKSLVCSMQEGYLVFKLHSIFFPLHRLFKFSSSCARLHHAKKFFLFFLLGITFISICHSWKEMELTYPVISLLLIVFFSVNQGNSEATRLGA